MSIRVLPFAVLLLAGCQGTQPEAPANEAAADDGLPVRPGVYGNVQPNQNGIELQVHKLPRKLIEVTFCEQGCKPIRRVPYQVEGEAMTFGYGSGGEAHTVRLTQQGEDVKAEGAGIGAEPVVLKRLAARDGLAKAEEAVRRGAQ
jgi:hypothetical protein